MEERDEMPEQKREAVELLASSNVVGGSYVPPHMRGQVIQINLSLDSGVGGGATVNSSLTAIYETIQSDSTKRTKSIFWVLLYGHPRQNVSWLLFKSQNTLSSNFEPFTVGGGLDIAIYKQGLVTLY